LSALEKLDHWVGRVLRIAGVLAFVAALLTRIVIGQAFYYTGKAKLAEPPVQFFSDLGIPFPTANAIFVANLEHYGGILLIIGLATRLTALLLSSTMVVAVLTAHRTQVWDAARGVGDAVLADITALTYLALLLWLVFFGPGALSLDALVKRAYQKKMRPAGTKPAAQD
jgi:putative oxidoreductase